MSQPSNQGAKRTVAFDEPAEPTPIDSDALRAFDGDITDYLRRLETDRSIIAELRESGFEGLHYDYFATEMAKYAIAVLTSWIHSKKIFAILKKRGMGLSEPPSDLLTADDHALELAYETVAVALKNFRTYVLIPGRWDPERKASIRTYFVGQCLMRFGNVYRQWYRETVKHHDLLEIDDRVKADGGLLEQVEHRADLAAVLSTVKKTETKEVLVLYGAGFSQPEIARRCNMTVKKVEMIMANERKRQIAAKASSR